MSTNRIYTPKAPDLLQIPIKIKFGRIRYTNYLPTVYSFIVIDLLIIAAIGLLQFWEFDQTLNLSLGVTISLVGLWFALFQLLSVGYGWTAAPTLYLLYLAMYHLLFVVPSAYLDEFAWNAMYRPSTGTYATWTINWLYTPGTNMSVLLITTGCIGIALGGVIVAGFRKSGQTRQTSTQDWHHHGLFYLGTVLQIASILLFGFALYRGGGANLLLDNYRTFRDNVTTGTVFSQANLFFGFGSILALAGAPRSQWKWPFVLFAIAALPLFFTGNRGEVLYPLLTMGMVLYRRNIVLPRVLIIAVIAGIAFLIPIVFQIRSVGIGSISKIDLSFEFERLIIDLGFALRPVSVVANWLLNGDHLLLGGSYWLPFERMLARFLPFIWERQSVLTDPRFVAYQGLLRTGSPMGFSVVAEALYNFGHIGPPFILSIIGAVLGWLHQQARSPIWLAVLGIVLFPLINSVRNTFIFVPGQIFIGLGLLFFAIQWQRHQARQSKPRAANKKLTILPTIIKQDKTV